ADVERANRDAADRRVAVALPIEVAAAIGTEIKTDLVAAIRAARKDVALALEPDALLQIGRAEMKGGAGAPPAGLAMAEIDSLRLAGGDDLDPPAMALRRSLCRSLLHRTHPPGCAGLSVPPTFAERRRGCRAGRSRAGYEIDRFVYLPRAGNADEPSDP